MGRKKGFTYYFFDDKKTINVTLLQKKMLIINFKSLFYNLFRYNSLSGSYFNKIDSGGEDRKIVRP